MPINRSLQCMENSGPLEQMLSAIVFAFKIGRRRAIKMRREPLIHVPGTAPIAYPFAESSRPRHFVVRLLRGLLHQFNIEFDIDFISDDALNHLVPRESKV